MQNYSCHKWMAVALTAVNLHVKIGNDAREKQTERKKNHIISALPPSQIYHNISIVKKAKCQLWQLHQQTYNNKYNRN